MKSPPRRSVSGPILARDLGGGLWQLSAAGPRSVHVFLRLAPGTGHAALEEPAIERLDLQWRTAGACVQVTGRNGMAVLEADTAIIHESDEHLYDALPLGTLDTRARRFWKRVFLLIRMPGGRYLLRLIARRRR